jgi:ATP-dependent Clp protease ATP-binding subunit ClpA
LIGREDIIERTIQVLSRRLKNNRFTLVNRALERCVTEGLATLIAEKRVPRTLRDYKIIAIDMGTLLAEQNIGAILKSVLKRC